MWCVAHERDGRRHLPILRLGSLHSGAQRVGARAYAFSYCRSSWRSSSMATPETVPVNSPVTKSAGALEALSNTGVIVAVIRKGAGRTLETPGSTCDLIIHGNGGAPGGEIDATDPSVTVTLNRLPSWKRNTPAPATTRKLWAGATAGGWGAGPSACSSRNVNGPSVPFPANALRR